MRGMARSTRLLYLTGVAFACVALSQATVGAAQRTVRATTAWVAVPEAGGRETMAFAVVDNGTMYDVYVVSAESDVAGNVELRQGKKAGPSEALSEAPVPAFGQLEMSPVGVHVLLKDLKRPLKPGDVVALVLTLDSGDRLTVSAPVK